MLIKILRDYSTKDNNCYAVLFIAFTFSIVIHLATVKAVMTKAAIVSGLLGGVVVHYNLIDTVVMLWNF